MLSAEPRADILVVDDNSPDGTGQLADELAARSTLACTCFTASRSRAWGGPTSQAFAWALAQGYQLIIEMDADFSHDPQVPAGADRHRAGRGGPRRWAAGTSPGGGTVNWGLVRRLISKGGSLYARSILGVRIRDLTGGFKCFNRRVLEAIDLDQVHASGYAFQIELTYRALKKGFTVKEIPIVFEDRRVGQSKMSRKIFLEAMTMVWKLKLHRVVDALDAGHLPHHAAGDAVHRRPDRPGADVPRDDGPRFAREVPGDGRRARR